MQTIKKFFIGALFAVFAVSPFAASAADEYQYQKFDSVYSFYNYKLDGEDNAWTIAYDNSANYFVKFNTETGQFEKKYPSGSCSGQNFDFDSNGERMQNGIRGLSITSKSTGIADRKRITLFLCPVAVTVSGSAMWS